MSEKYQVHLNIYCSECEYLRATTKKMIYFVLRKHIKPFYNEGKDYSHNVSII